MTKLNRLMASKNHPRPRELRPKASPRVIEDKTTSPEMPAALDEWQVVMLAPSANDGTLHRIADAGFHVWRPRMVRLISASSLGKSVYVNRPLWPRYAFIARRAGCTMALADVWSVGKPLMVGKLPGSVVDGIYRREAAGEFDCRTLPPAGFSFDPEASVETLDGLMRGIVLKSDEERTVVLFRLLDKEHEVRIETRKLRPVGA